MNDIIDSRAAGGDGRSSATASTRIGQYALHSITDGRIREDALRMYPQSSRHYWETRPEELVDGMLHIRVGCFLLVSDDATILIDAGSGSFVDRLPGDITGGDLPQALADLAISPKDVTAVIFTHLHADHCAGAFDSSHEPLFSDARVLTSAADLAYWREATGPMADSLRDVLADNLTSGLIEGVDFGNDILPGIALWSTPGHSPGHAAVHIVSDGDRALIAGDVTHHPVQIDHPDWAVMGDYDPAQALATRQAMFERIAGADIVLAACHYPGSGMGRIGVDADGRRAFVPMVSTAT